MSLNTSLNGDQKELHRDLHQHLLDTSIQSEVAEKSPSAFTVFFKRVFSPNHKPLEPIHDSTFGKFWITVVFVFVVYNLIAIPLRFAFRDEWTDSSAIDLMYSIDNVGDVIFVVDIYLNFRFSILKNGLLVDDAKSIRQHYLTSWFPLELFVSLPIDLFSFTIWKHALLRLPKVLRIYRCMQHFEKFEAKVQNGHLVQLAKLLIGVVIVNHWLGCLYFAVAYYEDFQTQEEGANEWLPPPYIADATLSEQYLWAFSWGTKIVTDVGEMKPPVTYLEVGFMLCISFIAVFVVAIIIGSVSEIISKLNEQQDELRSKMATINRFMKNRKLPPELRDRVRNYYLHMWDQNGGLDDSSVLDELPRSLQQDVSRSMHEDLIKKVDFLQECSPLFLSKLTRSLQPMIYAPGDVLTRVGDEGTEMFFINQGKVEITNNHGCVLAVRGEGSVLGEIALLSNDKRTATIRAITWSHVACLSQEAFDDACQKFPVERAKIQEVADVRIARDFLISSLVKLDIFTGTDPKMVKEIVDAFKILKLKRGHLLAEEGTNNTDLYFLAKGIAKMSVLASPEDPTVIRVDEIEAGRFVGLEGPLLKQPKHDRIRIASDYALVYHLTYEDFEDVMMRWPAEKREIHLRFTALKKRETSMVAKSRLTGAIRQVRQNLMSTRIFGAGAQARQEERHKIRMAIRERRMKARAKVGGVVTLQSQRQRSDISEDDPAGTEATLSDTELAQHERDFEEALEITCPYAQELHHTFETVNEDLAALSRPDIVTIMEIVQHFQHDLLVHLSEKA